ncbi:hypothetical protein [Helicobacter pylori]|uniref:hypothetical protein n=1 Tax=Helicobacter pylori TaxID=210 RepID=UPI0013CE075E|nr:hypothetical protein [Helicobacter pylori]
MPQNSSALKVNLKEIIEDFSQGAIMREAKIQTDKRLDLSALIDKHKQHPQQTEE